MGSKRSCSGECGWSDLGQSWRGGEGRGCDSESCKTRSKERQASGRQAVTGADEDRHLDEEVHDLGAESMKKAGWTLDEIRRIPM